MQEKSKGRNLRVNKDAGNLQCHIHDEVYSHSVNEIHKNVCVKGSDYPLWKHSDGKYYCLFHIPVQKKNTAKFKEIFQSRLDSVKQKAAEIEELSEEGHEEAKRELSYDFRYVWFPSRVDLANYKFQAHINFSGATFSGESYFVEATFSTNADFIGTNFLSNSYFSSANFSKNADFSYSTFSGNVEFSSAIFEEDSQISFKASEFYGNVLFTEAKVKGYIHFEMRPEISEKNYTLCFEGRRARLDLQKVIIEDAKRISFHLVRLQPHWFINTDARKYVFTDCWWKDNENVINAEREIQSLIDLNVRNPHRVLGIACQQLAINAENNNHYQNASFFRSLAFEVEWSEKKQRFWIWDLLIILRILPETRHRDLRTKFALKPKKELFKIGIYWAFYNTGDFITHGIYRFTSYYGEDWVRAFFVLVSILAGFTLYYHSTFFSICPKNVANSSECVIRALEWSEAVHQSLMTATLQNVEYRKTLTAGQDLVLLLEKILAPLQAALLALAIKRKFMR